MRNRILSLVMAICMVVVAVPAFVLPMTAASTEGFKTTFSATQDTWPKSDTTKKVFLGYPTAWEAGYMDAKGVYTTYTGLDGVYNILNNSGSDQWSWGGIYLGSARYILTGTNNIFDPVNNANSVGFTLNYVSPYEGTVDLDFESISAVSAESKSMEYYFAVFVNGTMIWPNAGDYYSDVSKWAYITDTTLNKDNKTPLDQYQAMNRDALKNVKVNRGDNIQFVCGHKGACYVYYEPSVTFADNYLIVPTNMSEALVFGGSEWPVLGNAQGIKNLPQTSNKWSFGYVDADGSFAPFASYYRKGTEAYACGDGRDYETNGAIMLASATAALRGGAVFGAKTIGYEYTSVATGKLYASIADMTILVKDADTEAIVPATSGKVDVKVYKNGTLATTVSATATAEGITVDWAAAANQIDVVRGDKILVTLNPDADICAVNGSATATYSTIDSFMTETTTDTYALQLQDGTAIFGDTFGVTFYAYGTTAVYNNFKEAGLYYWGKDVAEADRTAANAQKLPATMNDTFGFEANYDKITAKEMADALAVQAYVVVNDNGTEKTITSKISTKSVADYVTADYEKATDKMLKNVLVAMLNYGAYAQTYFNYNTDNLANKALPDSLKVMDPDTLYYASFDGEKGSSKNICNTEIDGFSLVINNDLSMKVYIKIDPTEKGNTMQLQVAESKSDLGNTTYKMDSNGEYAVYEIENISLTEMSKTFYFRVQVRYGPTWYYGYTFSYSVESYAARMVDSTEPGLSNLVRSMMEFGKAINAYNA